MEDDLKKQGYSKEEEYFRKLNQELLDKMKTDSEDKNESEVDKDDE